MVKRLGFYAQTTLPTRHGLFNCMIFRDDEGREHVAMVKGALAGAEDVVCRIHSECLTSEVFDSQKCDCKQQLDAALDRIQKCERGVLLYLRQEGRGIGLGNKIKAYALQENGLDTVDANEALGLPVDARDYNLAAEMLSYLEVLSVRLLTNNPLKVQGLQQAGFRVVREQSTAKLVSEQAAQYVSVKQKKLGHFET